MTYTPELHALVFIAAATLLMWVPYTLARMAKRGIMGAMANPDPGLPPDPAWAERAKMAHYNAIENLAVFAPIVIVAAMLGAGTPATALAAKVYVAARLVHYVVYAAGITVVRTLAFVTGVAATFVIAYPILCRVVM